MEKEEIKEKLKMDKNKIFKKEMKKGKRQEIKFEHE